MKRKGGERNSIDAMLRTQCLLAVILLLCDLISISMPAFVAAVAAVSPGATPTTAGISAFGTSSCVLMISLIKSGLKTMVNISCVNELNCERWHKFSKKKVKKLLFDVLCIPVHNRHATNNGLDQKPMHQFHRHRITFHWHSSCVFSFSLLSTVFEMILFLIFGFWSGSKR